MTCNTLEANYTCFCCRFYYLTVSLLDVFLNSVLYYVAINAKILTLRNREMHCSYVYISKLVEQDTYM